MRLVSSVAFIAAAAFFWGCSVNVVTEGSGASGGSGGSGGSTGASGPGGGGTGGTAGGDACSIYDDQPGTGTATVRIVNQSDRPVYFQAGCGVIPFEVQPIAGAPEGEIYNFDRSCLTTCGMLRRGEFGACPDCAPGVYMLPVGGSHEEVWDATLLRQMQMPLECAPEANSVDCSRNEPVAAGEYRIATTAWDTCEDCECQEDDLCWGIPSGLSAYADVRANYPAPGIIEIVLDGCAFGCP